MSFLQRLKDAAGVVSSMLASAPSATSPSIGAQALVAAAIQAGSTLDVLQQLRHQEQHLIEQLAAQTRHEHVDLQHASSLHGAPAASSSTAASSQEPPLLAALRVSREHVPAPLLDRMTRFAVEEGLGHLIRGLGRGTPSVVGSTAPSRDADPFGILMALGPQHALRPLTFQEYLSACTTLSQNGGELLLRGHGLRAVHTYCRVRRALLRAWSGWPPAGAVADPQVVSQVAQHVRSCMTQLRSDEVQLTALATWRDSHMRMLRRDTTSLDLELLEMQLSSKLGSGWAAGAPAYDALQRAKPVWARLVSRVHSADTAQESSEGSGGTDTTDQSSNEVGSGSGDGMSHSPAASTKNAAAESSSQHNLMYLSPCEWAVLEQSLHAVAAALHPARTVKANVTMQLYEDREEAEARLAAYKQALNSSGQGGAASAE